MCKYNWRSLTRCKVGNYGHLGVCLAAQLCILLFIFLVRVCVFVRRRDLVFSLFKRVIFVDIQVTDESGRE